MGIGGIDELSPPEVCHQILSEIENELDLSYFYLTNDAFFSLLPELEVNHLLKIEHMNLTGNSIDDDALIELVDTLLNIHNKSLVRVDIDETLIGDRGVTALIDSMQRITSISHVETGTLRLSKDVRDKLNAACRKNEIFGEDQAKLGMMFAAAKKLDDYDA